MPLVRGRWTTVSYGDNATTYGVTEGEAVSTPVNAVSHRAGLTGTMDDVTRPLLELAAPPRSTDTTSASRAALAAAVLGFFIVTFDAVVVNVALPSIRTDLGTRRVVTAGLLVMAGGLALLAALASTAAPSTIAILMLPVGLAGPLVMPPVTATLLNSVPDTLAGTASGVFNTSRQLGGALAIAVFGALLATPDGFAHGMRISLSIAGIVALAAATASRTLTTPARLDEASAALGMCDGLIG